MASGQDGPTIMTPMMEARRAAIDSIASAPPPENGPWSLEDLTIDVQTFPQGARGGPGDELVGAIVGALTGGGSPRVALVTGLDRTREIGLAREFHRRLFDLVWLGFRSGCPDVTESAPHRTKESVIADGRIPLELHGTAWSFKQLHADRDVLLFSHLYGPVGGFTGGDIVLVDVARFVSRYRIPFDVLCEWSDEPSEGSKPVIRTTHEDNVRREVGITVPAPPPDQILFINNSPSAGVFHGVTPLAITDTDAYVRDYHRCAAKELSS